MEEQYRVSDEAFEDAISGGVMSRDTYRRLKQADRKGIERYIASVYRSGFEDGYNEACNSVGEQIKAEAAAKFSNPDAEYEEVKADWEDVLRIIAEVKGMTPKLTAAIDEKLREVMG